jgi:hypothetical protein
MTTAEPGGGSRQGVSFSTQGSGSELPGRAREPPFTISISWLSASSQPCN